jgi:uncharacterized protein (TIGR02001 family)
MRRNSTLTVLAMLALAPPSSAVEFSGYAVLTTDYVFRGVTYSDGDPAVQLSGDLSFDNGFFGGAWMSTMDIESAPGRQRDFEVNYYLGYGLPLNRDWSLSAAVVAFTYPGATGAISYNYEEITLALNYNDRLWLEYSFSPDLYGSGAESHNLELYGEFPIPGKFVMGLGAGRYDTSALTGSAYNYWHAGVSRAFGQFEFDLRYHDTDDWVPIISTPERAEARLVLSAKLFF